MRIPVGFKDIIAVGGKPLTAGSRALDGNLASSDSHAWERAREQGMVLLGHTKSQEFASVYDIVRNVEVGAFQQQKLMTDPTKMSPEYLSRVSSGILAPGHAYAQAQRVRRVWREQFLAVFDEVDVFIHPADDIAGFKPPKPNPARPRPSSGSKTNIWNISGAPAIAIPTGLSEAEKMPLSMQVVAMTGNDSSALFVAHAFQTATRFHKLRPSL